MAVIFAVLVAAGVVMGMLALTIDVGAIMWERRQLQNAADATSTALAYTCAKQASMCAANAVEPNANTVAANLAALAGKNHANAAVQLLRPGLTVSRADAPNGMCGRNTGNTTNPVPLCASASTNAPVDDLAQCPPLPTWLTGTGAVIPYVETYTLTKSTQPDDSKLRNIFGQALTGQYSAKSHIACARAAWGQPGGFSASVPMTFSACEWKAATSNGTDYVQDSPSGAWPGYGGSGQPAWPPVSKERVIILHDPADESADCSWNGKDTSGGFGYVASSGNCSANVTTDNWAQIDNGNNVPTGCDTALQGLRGRVVNVPVFDCLIASSSQPVGPVPATANCDPTQQLSSGSNTWYHIAGWAKFYLSGYKLSGTGGTVANSLLTGNPPCTGGQRCLSGWFLKGSLDASTIVPPGGGSDFGTYTVLPAG
ncbi:MAG TPA: pilus assembly protein TadG-related protein [Intrasporangium sp.]|nr:pilus assembly protein TadG-related protein [Intrasporangium sp.]